MWWSNAHTIVWKDENNVGSIYTSTFLGAFYFGMVEVKKTMNQQIEDKEKETVAEATVIARDDEYWSNWTPGVPNQSEDVSNPIAPEIVFPDNLQAL
jgi:hypothetical protein